MIYADQCPKDKYPDDPDAKTCYEKRGHNWCSDAGPYTKSEWGAWICKKCESCRARHRGKLNNIDSDRTFRT